MGKIILTIAFISSGALVVLWAIDTAVQWWEEGEGWLAAAPIVASMFAVGLFFYILETEGVI